MKTCLISLIFLLGLVVTTIDPALSAGNNKTFAIASGNNSTTPVSVSYANSQVDTLILWREAKASAYSLTCSWADSVSITNIILRRLVNGVLMPVVAGDTLLGATATTASTSQCLTITLQPMPEAYRIIVTYASSANGVTSATARYSAQRVY